MTIAQLMLFTFISMWVIGDVTGATYLEKISWAIMMTLGIGYFNNAHRVLWQKIRHLK